MKPGVVDIIRSFPLGQGVNLSVSAQRRTPLSSVEYAVRLTGDAEGDDSAELVVNFGNDKERACAAMWAAHTGAVAAARATVVAAAADLLVRVDDASVQLDALDGAPVHIDADRMAAFWGEGS